MSPEQTLFKQAEQALQQVVHEIQDDQWDQPATNVPTMSTSTETPTLRELINRHVYDDLWVTDTLAGKTIAEVGSKYDGDLLGNEPFVNYDRGVAAAIAAVEALTPSDLDKNVHLTYGDFQAREYLKHISTYRGFRVYSIAKSIGVDSTMPDGLVQNLWDLIVPEVEGWRAMGIFGPVIAVAEDADLQTKLLGITGFLQV